MIRQNIVFVENKAGSLRKVTKILKENQINIYGCACFDAPEFAIFRMICDAPEKAEEVLNANGYMNRMTSVIGVDLRDEIGGLDELLGVFEDCNVSLDYIYNSFRRADQVPVAIIGAEEIFETESILKNRGFRVLSDLKGLE